jgi:hypothetical protein
MTSLSFNTSTMMGNKNIKEYKWKILLVGDAQVGKRTWIYGRQYQGNLTYHIIFSSIIIIHAKLTNKIADSGSLTKDEVKVFATNPSPNPAIPTPKPSLERRLIRYSARDPIDATSLISIEYEVYIMSVDLHSDIDEYQFLPSDMNAAFIMFDVCSRVTYKVPLRWPPSIILSTFSIVL